MTLQRKSGVLLHPTSLPGPYGIGTLNPAAYQWLDFLARARQQLWQLLPLGPTGYGDSPYQSFSSFAGNPYLISLEQLVEEGFLAQSTLDQAPKFSPDLVDYGAIYAWKLPLLRSVSATFRQNGSTEKQDEFAQFCADNGAWLDDFALFMALKDAHNGAPWNQWEMDLRGRKAAAIKRATDAQSDAIYGHKFNQWLFYRQWDWLRSYANERGIQIVGDIPIFVAMDSVDAWTNPSEFFLDEAFQPSVVAGVPPDYFSETGQLWGNPLYRWDKMRANDYAWWQRRIQAALRLYDIVRVDHFRGFANYWEVPASEATAVNGRWMDGPGAHFFEVIQRELGSLPIIAEDLGEIDQAVLDLRDQFSLPGMKVLQFAFGGDAGNHFLPHNYTPNFVVYTGTHDNDTTVGWFDTSPEHLQDHLRRYLRTDGSDVAWHLIEAAFSSTAATAIVPLQDLLRLDTHARMNLPGRASGNWGWRYQADQLNDELADQLRDLTELYGRVG